MTQRSNLESEISRLDIQMDMYRRCRENIVASRSLEGVEDYNTVIVNNGGTAITISTYDATLANIDALIDAAAANRDTAAGQMETIINEMAVIQGINDEIHEEVSITTYFTQEEYDELYDYIYQGTYTDEYVTVTDGMSYNDIFSQMKLLYDRAKEQLERISHPTKKYTVGMESFLFAKAFRPWAQELETGCLINVELEEGDVAPIFLTSITVNYADKHLDLVLGSRFNRYDMKSLYDNVLGSVTRTANAVNFLKSNVKPIKSQFNAMQEALQTSRNLTKDAALSSTGESVLIDDTGYTGRRIVDGVTDPHQVKLVSKNLVFTDDAWRTSKVAIGELITGNGDTAYGINAETIIGDLIIGNGLQILDNEGNPLLDVVDGRISMQVGDLNEAVFGDPNNPDDGLTGRMTTLEQTVSGITISVSEVETTTGYTFNADGLTIRKSEQEILNKLDNTGMYVKRSTGGSGDNETFDDVLTANADGVSAINLTARQYLTIGSNSRFEDFSRGGTDTKRTACYFVG